MGLTRGSVGRGALGEQREKEKEETAGRTVALAGNPNVGKSTVFNALTGMHQHTGNWPGKTVATAMGSVRSPHGELYTLVDIPGTYSLLAHSAEEEIARNFLCFGGAEATVVVCDATCLERNLNLVLQVREVSARTVVCVNLMDEARRKGIKVNLARLEECLGVPVVGTEAKKPSTLRALLSRMEEALCAPSQLTQETVLYPREIENAIEKVSRVLEKMDTKNVNKRWLSARILEGDTDLLAETEAYLGFSFSADAELCATCREALSDLCAAGIGRDGYRDLTVGALVSEAERIASLCVENAAGGYTARDRQIDRILTGRYSAYPLMLLFLGGIFFLTVYAANYPSAWLSALFTLLEGWLGSLVCAFGAPPWLYGLLIEGTYRTLAWVVSVMLPPMAIFFPLFTLLEDAGFLPRIAYNLDRPFRACRACGKQALTMCMGFGCNAAGVVGCRIIDSERERRLAILTNSLVPCNGRFPMMITLLSLFFVGVGSAVLTTVSVALLLTGAILLSVLVTLGATRLLSGTLLRGTPSSFTLELPPYRRPEIGRVLVRSLFDRTAFVLGRAAAVAAPAGAVIWLLANLTMGGESLLSLAAGFLNPIGRAFGMDGVILIAFLLGFPANEIVIPLMLMAYTSGSALTEVGTVGEIREILLTAGWTPLTVLSVTLFSLFHFPCSTTLLTVRRETGSTRLTLLAFFLPLAIGLLLCLSLRGIAALFARLLA